MGRAKFSIYKNVKTAKGWRYCRPTYSANNKIKPNIVLVDGKEDLHPEVGSAQHYISFLVPFGPLLLAAGPRRRGQALRRTECFGAAKIRPNMIEGLSSFHNVLERGSSSNRNRNSTLCQWLFL
jgi:hypothetical protein